MKNLFRQWGAVFLMGLTMGAVQAQSKAPTKAPSKAQTQEQTGLNVNALNSAAANVLVAIDAGQVQQVYQVSSVTMKNLNEEKVFVKDVVALRKSLGAATARRWQASSYNVVGPQGAIPGGEFVSVSFISSFNNASAVREIVSMRLDEDGSWRFVGYSATSLVAEAAK